MARVQKLEVYWQEFENGSELVKKGNKLLKEGLLMMAEACSELLDRNDLELIKKMRQALGKESVLMTDISAYLTHLYPEHERYIQKVLPDQLKRVYQSELVRNGSEGSDAVMIAGSRITKKDLVHSPLEDFKSLLKLVKEAVRTRRGEVAQEPAMSQYLDVWDGIGQRPDDCYAGNNFVKYGKMLLATHGKHDSSLCKQFGASEHCPEGVCAAGFLALKYGYLLLASHPEHGKRFCYTHGELPAPYIDERHSAEAGIQGVEDAIATILVREQSVRHMFDGLLMQTSKWGSIRVDRIVDFLQREGFDIPQCAGFVEIQTGEKEDGTPIMEKDPVYTNQQKKYIMELVRDYYVAPMDTKTLKGMILEKIIAYLRDHGVKVPEPKAANGEYTPLEKQEILSMVRQTTKNNIKVVS